MKIASACGIMSYYNKQLCVLMRAGKIKVKERMEKKIPLSTPTMHGDEMKYIEEAFERNWIAPLGFNCDAFEHEIADYLARGGEACHALAVASGTAAIHLAVKLAGVKRGDVVLCTDMTFCASANPVTYEGATQVFVDSEPDTWNMDPRALEAAFEKYPSAKAVILVHLYGTPAKCDEIRDICRRRGAVLIEDAAEALSATYKGEACGTLGDLNVLSFNGNKIITTSGGGMLLTRDKALRDKALFYATQAREAEPWYQHEEIGYNYRMSNIVAGIGRGQLPYISEHCARKRAIYERYKAGFAGLPVKMNPYLECSEPNFWLSCITIDESSPVTPMQLIEALDAAGIESRPIWKPMHLQPVFADRDFISAQDTPVSEYVFNRGLCLPSDIKMTEEEQDYVISVVRGVLEVKNV